MVKVILITTRKVKNVIDGNIKYHSIVADKLQQQFLISGKGTLFNEALKNIIENSYWNTAIKDIPNCELTLILSTHKPFANQSINDIMDNYDCDEWFQELSIQLREKIVEELIRNLRNETYNEDSTLHWNKIYKIDNNINNNFIYVAHEFFTAKNEKKEHKEKKAAYLNAILSDVFDDLIIKDKNSIEFSFISHDADWGEDKSACQLNNEYLSNFGGDKLKNTLFRNICIKENTSAYIFQHSNNDKIYKYIISNFNQVNNELINDDDYLEKILDTLSSEDIDKSNNKYIVVKAKKKSFGTTDDLNFIVENCKEYKPIIIFGIKPLKNLIKTSSDKRLNFLDSSIWIRYADNKDDFEKLKVEILNCNDLYNTYNAKEIKEFRFRIALNSSLSDIRGDHAKYVVPFLFHSETKMKNKAITTKVKNGKTKNSLLDKLKKNGKQEWRFLIVDDHATIESVVNAETNGASKDSIIPKCKIINNILSNHFNIKCCKCEYNKDGTIKEDNECRKECQISEKKSDENNITIYLDCATKIKDDKETKIEGAISKIEKTKYDLILLDYLLDEKSDGTRYYAHDFLKKIDIKCKIRDNKEPLWTVKNNKIGPKGKFHIFYISAFTNAVHERMLEQGLEYHYKYWNISRGACPTTTPYLFLYYLLKQMISQIEEFTKISEEENLKDVTTLLDLLLEIYGRSKKPRERAIRLFNPLLKMRLNYDILKYDVCEDVNCNIFNEQNASKLVTSLFPDITFYDNAFWEHTMHLVYLTAYGTNRQWPDMWEEFMQVKPYLQEASKKLKNEGNENSSKAIDVINGIEEYINSLQKSK